MMKDKGTLAMEKYVWIAINTRVKEIIDRLETLNVDCWHDKKSKWKFDFEKVK
jgi:hypothetical protein